ncbi:MAG: hypothetical protein E7222_10745 [Clostridiales bacterium]|nr:hypothetical protein [Clostridiales bacterium]
MIIYSLLGLKKNLEENHTIEIINEAGEVTRFKVSYESEDVINMPYVGTDFGNCNSQGWLRDSRYFFKALLSIRPECFSDENKEKIERGRNPICDKRYISFFPEFSNYQGEKLVHHHIGQDGQAVALPQSCHIGSGGIHNFDLELGITNNAKKFSEEVQVRFGAEPLKYSWVEAQKIADKINAVDNYKKTERQASKYKKGEGKKTYGKSKAFITAIGSKIKSLPLDDIKKELVIVGSKIIGEIIIESLNRNAKNKEVSPEGYEPFVTKKGVSEEIHNCGSSASKSPHDRSGHIRHYKDGRETFISPAKINGGKQ